VREKKNLFKITSPHNLSSYRELDDTLIGENTKFVTEAKASEFIVVGNQNRKAP